MRGYCAVGLNHPRDPYNIGGVLRAAHCFGASFVSYTGKSYKRHGADTTKAWKRMPLFHVEDLKIALPYDCVPVAVEFIPTATSLSKFVHPERALYIFGPEAGSLGEETLSWCKHVLFVPTTFCLNLAACVNVVLYDRLSKQL